jgi:hypothetical protein
LNQALTRPPQLYLQEALGFSALMSGVLLLPQVFSQGLALGLAGWVASTTGYVSATKGSWDGEAIYWLST